jgi:hypothetical protein
LDSVAVLKDQWRSPKNRSFFILGHRTMFHDEQQLGDFTTTSIETYWIGHGIAWRFSRGSCCRLPALLVRGEDEVVVRQTFPNRESR